MKHRFLMVALVSLGACSGQRGGIEPLTRVMTATPQTSQIAPGEQLQIVVKLREGMTELKGNWTATFSTGGVVNVLTISNQITERFEMTVVGDKPGTTTITFKSTADPSITTTATVVVVANVATLAPTPVNLQVGGSPMFLTTTWKNFRSEPLSGTVDWTIDDAKVATVKPNPANPSQGIVTPVAVGKTKVRATLTGATAGGVTIDTDVNVDPAPASSCISDGTALTFTTVKVSDPGLFSGTIAMQDGQQITVNFSATATPGNIQATGGSKMNGWNVDQMSAVGPAPSAANGCAMDLNLGSITFGPGPHKTRLYGPGLKTPGTKLTYDFLDFLTGALQTRYELTVR